MGREAYIPHLQWRLRFWLRALVQGTRTGGGGWEELSSTFRSCLNITHHAASKTSSCVVHGLSASLQVYLHFSSLYHHLTMALPPPSTRPPPLVGWWREDIRSIVFVYCGLVVVPLAFVPSRLFDCYRCTPSWHSFLLSTACYSASMPARLHGGPLFLTHGVQGGEGSGRRQWAFSHYR